MSKYAPANAAGEKPYILEMSDWGRKYTRLVYASNAAKARAKAGRSRVGFSVTAVRRALMEEISK